MFPSGKVLSFEAVDDRTVVVRLRRWWKVREVRFTHVCDATWLFSDTNLPLELAPKSAWMGLTAALLRRKVGF